MQDQDSIRDWARKMGVPVDDAPAGAQAASTRPPTRATPSKAPLMSTGCLLAVVLFVYIPLMLLLIRNEWLLAAGLVSLFYAVMILGDAIPRLVKAVYMLPIIVFAVLVFGEDLSDLADQWQRQQARDSDRQELQAFYTRYYPAVTEARMALGQQLEAVTGRLHRLDRIDAGSPEQQEDLRQTRQHLIDELDRLRQARQTLDDEMLRLYLGYIEDGDPYGDTISEDVNESVLKAQDVLHGLEEVGER